MLRTVVVYRSISGFTKKYAEWIANDLSADIYDIRELNIDRFIDYDLIIFGGSLHAVGINGVKFIKENLGKLSEKKIVIFAVGASPPKENVLDEIRNNNFSDEQQKKIMFYYLRGGFDYSKLNFSNQVLMTLYRIRLKMKKNRTSDEIGMLAAYSKPIDCTKKENIKNIIESARSVK
jgi:menaquinone-dependent protoporphyrinogen IX oxidase